MPQRRPDLSVVVPVYNGADDLERCLTAIERSSLQPAECIVVDDGSTDGSAEVARRHGARVIELRNRRGPAHARNQGAVAARGDVLFFTDADVCVHEDTLAVAAEVLARDDGLAAVIGSYDAEPGHASFLSQYKNLFHHWVHQTSNEAASTFWTGCGAIRREVFLAAGGFHVGYTVPSIEDIELGFRLRRAGQRIRLEKRMCARHMKHWRFWNLLYTDVFRRGVPWIALMLRDRFAPEDLNLSRESKLGTVFAYLLAISLVVLPIAGRALAVLPFLAAALAAIGCVALRERAGRTSWRTPASLALVLGAPLLALSLAPGPLALLPFALLPFALWLGIVWTHRPFYAFMRRQRGIVFACAVAPFHVLFQLSCGACVPLGIVAHALDVRRARRSASSPAVRSIEPLALGSGEAEPGGARA